MTRVGCYVLLRCLVPVLVLAGLSVIPFLAFAQGEDQKSPVVTAAAVPLYPRTAQLVHIQGTVVIRATTDGRRVSSVVVESGPPMLARAAEENIRTWQFQEHKRTTLHVTYDYVLETPAVCDVENSAVALHLPLAVRITTREVRTCDPSSTTVPEKKQ